MHRCLLPALVAIACGGRHESVAPPTPSPTPVPHARPAPPPEDPAISDAVAAAVRSHEILTSVSVVPASSPVLCNAAMGAADAAIGQPPEAVAWSGDKERDRRQLRSRVAGVLARATDPLPSDLPLRLARAMAMAAKNPHVFALDAGGVATLLALVSGQAAPGLGFSAHAAGGRWIVADVYPGSPAAGAGLRPGFALVSLDGRAFDEQSLLATLFIAAGGKATIEFESLPPTPYRKLVELEAAVYPRPIVDSRVLAKGIGYVRLHGLPRSQDPQTDAGGQLAGALGELHKKKMAKLVVDLRDNPGGNPFAVASLLVRGDPLLQAQVPGQKAEPVPRTGPIAPALARPLKLAVLVNGQSYSAAEMVALALQAHGEARVFGQPTGGALTFPGQEQLPGGVTLFFPQSLALDAKGAAPADQRVTPDEVVASTGAADFAAGVDPQLDAALAWLKKR